MENTKAPCLTEGTGTILEWMQMKSSSPRLCSLGRPREATGSWAGAWCKEPAPTEAQRQQLGRDPTPGQFFSRRIKSKKCGTCLPVTQKMARGTPELRTNTVSTLAKHQALSEEIRPAFPQSQALFSTANTKHSLASTVRTQIQATSSRRDGFLATTWLHTLPLRGKCHRKAQREEVGGLRAVNP